jgi:hypothetical protein
MQELMFEEESHIYTLQGEVLPCVSDLCRFLHREIYKDAPSWAMEAAAERGTAVHEAAQQLDSTGTADIPDEYAPYLQAYAAFLREHDVEWMLIEQPLYHPQHLYAGTIDRYGIVDGFHTLVDLKTTYTIYKPLCGAQLNLYRLMLIIRGYPVQRLAILHLKKDGTYRFVRFDIDDIIPNALLALHNALRKRKKKRSTK